MRLSRRKKRLFDSSSRVGGLNLWSLIKSILVFSLILWAGNMAITGVSYFRGGSAASDLPWEQPIGPETTQDRAYTGDLLEMSDKLTGALGSDAEAKRWIKHHPNLRRDFEVEWINRRFSDADLNTDYFLELTQKGYSDREAYFLSFLRFSDMENMFVSKENVKVVKSGQLPTKKAIDKWLPQRSPRPRFGSCAVVGNAGILKKHRFGSIIDKHDAVFRLNQAPVKGYEKLVGSRTTYRVLNNKWAVVYYEDNVPSTDVPGGTKQLARYLINQEVKNTTFIVTRSDSKTFESLASTQMRRRPDMATWYLSPQIIKGSRRVLQAFGKTASDDSTSVGAEITPSSGLVASYLALQMCGAVSLYGFALLESKFRSEMKDHNTTYHYFKRYADSEKLLSHPHHSFKLEGMLYQALEDIGFLKLCGAIRETSRDESNDCAAFAPEEQDPKGEDKR